MANEMPDWSVEKFLTDLKDIQTSEGVDCAIDHVLTCMNYLLHIGAFEEVQKVIDTVDVVGIDSSVLYSMCTMAWNAQRDGLIFEPFRKKCMDEILRVNPDKQVERIFAGLMNPPTGVTLGSMLRGIGQGNQGLY